MTLKSTTRAQGGSIIATIPAEVARRLAISPGQELYWRESAAGSYTVTALDPEQEEALAAMEEVVEQYREVFAALAR